MASSSSSSKKASSSLASHEAFTKVDDLVAKPVLGSDGASKWQDFTSSNKIQSRHVAPSMPLKKADRAVGFTSLEKEREIEKETRLSHGQAAMGAGYTVFKRKNTAEEAAEKKRQKLILDRVKPDEMTYFIAADTFQGWKHDYVFTTRHRGTGYYWDGMDSVKKLKNGGDSEQQPGESAAGVTEGDSVAAPDAEREVKKKKKKKKKSEKSNKPIMVIDPNSPLEQVANAIQKRRNQQMLMPPSMQQQLPQQQNGLPANTNQIWETATDPSTGKTYYYCRATGERSWDVPRNGSVLDKTKDEGASSTTTNKEDATNKKDSSSAALPPGWKSAKDPNTGKEYYYHTSGETKWEPPTT